MGFPYDRSRVRSLPCSIASKTGQAVRLDLLGTDEDARLKAMYLAYQPRNSFQGLPPIRDEICVRWVEDMLATGIHIVARSGDPEILGHCALFPMSEQRSEILVVVTPEHQNIGIGTQLTRSVVHLGRELGFEKLLLTVAATNLRARHVYKKCGFEYTSTGPCRELDMACDLTRPAALREDPPQEWNPAPHFAAGDLDAETPTRTTDVAS